VSVTIRLADPADAEPLAVLHLRVWEEAYTGLVPRRVLDERRARPLPDRTQVWRGRLALPEQDTWVAIADGPGGAEIVGFAESGRGRDGSGRLELMALYVRASHYGTGLGHRLLVTAIGDRPAYLWVLDGNARAIRFYERHGFAFDGEVEEHAEGLHRRMVRAARTRMGTSQHA
jgi:ribosomal protein S18 acetylase RimI-like enzyme